MQDQFSAFVVERNELVHHFLERYSLATDDSARLAVAHLEAQRTRIAPVRDILQSWLESAAGAQKELASFMASTEAKGVIERFVLQGSRIVALLATAAQSFARPDGGPLLSTAGNYVRREAPEELATMKGRFGHSTLKRRVIASELFELLDEPTTTGPRVLFRLRPEYLTGNVHS